MPQHQTCLIAGVMSGTSADGVDVALVRIDGMGLGMSARLIHHHPHPYDPSLKRAIFALRGGGPVALADLARVGRDISLAYAVAVNAALAAANVKPTDVAAVAAHGQTLYHQPPDTIQWLDPALLAAETGCPVVSDFRRADCAAGGQGAPLVPFADYVLFRDAARSRVLLNIGGIANLTFLPAGAKPEDVIAFDTGPGNCICDALCRQFDPCGPGYDTGGRMAEGGEEAPELTAAFLRNAYFAAHPPKSTDTAAMLDAWRSAIAAVGKGAPSTPANLVMSAAVITGRTIRHALDTFLPHPPDELIASGGGVRNPHIMSALKRSLDGRTELLTLEQLGLSPEAKEAVAFALMGAATLDSVPSNLPSCTGARRTVILGSITPRP